MISMADQAFFPSPLKTSSSLFLNRSCTSFGRGHSVGEHGAHLLLFARLKCHSRQQQHHQLQVTLDCCGSYSYGSSLVGLLNFMFAPATRSRSKRRKDSLANLPPRSSRNEEGFSSSPTNVEVANRANPEGSASHAMIGRETELGVFDIVDEGDTNGKALRECCSEGSLSVEESSEAPKNRQVPSQSLDTSPLVDLVSAAAKEPVYEVLEVDSIGGVAAKTVNRRQLLKSSGLRLRDIRSVDPSLWVTNSAPALIVRDQAILLKLGSLRAIATTQNVLIFDYKSIGAKAFLEILLPRFKLDSNPVLPAMPFELEVVEAALISRTQRLERRLMEIEPRVLALLEVLPNCLTANVLEELRLSKQALVELGSKAGALRQMLLELLESPQEIRRMTIMGRRCTIKKEDGSIECVVSADKILADDEEEEMEMLLENYLQRCESCHGQAERLLESAREMEDSIGVNLSSRRLEVSRLELLLQVGTFCSALGALVAGIFGMNLRSYLEGSAVAFWTTTGGIILGAIVLCFLMLNHLRKKKIL